MTNTNKKLPAEYRKLCRYLWERINATSNDDTESLDALGSITYSLLEPNEAGEKGTVAIYDDDGYMWELTEWISLKQDAPDAFKDYGEGLKQKDWPEIFED